MRVVATENMIVPFACAVTGVPGPEVTWYMSTSPGGVSMNGFIYVLIRTYVYIYINYIHVRIHMCVRKWFLCTHAYEHMNIGRKIT